MSSPPSFHAPGQIRFWLCVGFVLGTLGAVLLAWRWTATGSGTVVSVLGAGKSVSVLISHDQRRVLIASGNNGPAFSNALGAALPPLVDSIDVLLVVPGASSDLAGRARSLDVKQTLALPDPRGYDVAEAISRSFQIDLGDGVVLSVRIEPDTTWTAELATSAGRISIAPTVGRSAAPVRIALEGPASEDIGGAATILIGPAANGLARTSHQATVGAGSVLLITVDGSAFRIPRSFFGGDSLDQGADHLAHLDRQPLLELRPD